MRLDKFLCDCSDLTRSQAGKLIRQGEVMVDGILVKQPAFHINEQSLIEFDGVTLTLNQQNRYFMLHKPEGYVCSNEDPDHATVFHLLDEPAMGKLHVVGRLDLDTTGLVLITDDGQWSHRITSPRHECAKTYHVWLAGYHTALLGGERKLSGRKLRMLNEIPGIAAALIVSMVVLRPF